MRLSDQELHAAAITISDGAQRGCTGDQIVEMARVTFRMHEELLERRAEESRISETLKELDKNPLKDGDRIELNHGWGCIRVLDDSVCLSWAKGLLSLDGMMPLLEMAIRGGAVVIRGE